MDHPDLQSPAVAEHSSGQGSPQKGPTGRWGLSRVSMVVLPVVLGMLAGGALVYFALERPALEAAQVRAQGYEQELAVVRGRLQRANSAAAALEGQLLVEESTRRGLETTLRTLQGELGRAQDTLAFYEQLMPPGPKGAVTIRALDIQPVGPHLEYRLLLMRSGSNDKPFQGNLQFLADGHLDGEAVTLPLWPIVMEAEGQANKEGLAAATDNTGAPGAAAGAEQAETHAELLAVEFADFQRGSGLLGLPQGFEPKSVTVNVLEGRTLRTSRSIALHFED